MITSGFTNAPVSQFLVFATVIGALAASLTDTRYYIHIQVVPHIWKYGQFWRFLTWQSFLLATLPYTTLLPPLILTFILRPLSFGRVNYLPAGPVPIIFALLANYYAAIPYTYRYKIAPYSSASPTSSSAPNAAQTATSIWAKSITFTSKATTYLPPLQLALSQLPGSLLGAAVGWTIGTAYRRDVLPYASTWRVPGWMVGEEKKRGFEGLRARLDAERERRAREVGEAEEDVGDMVAEQFQGRG
ncbi:hypothetical protein N0V90_007337 [Kalmusia sp. IMI 367209]|nr:hypothetical protein N0V90_007337 [Kalmusia sp. IMI 367209]